MGLTYHAVKMLKLAKAEGASFARVCQVGRQALVIHPKQRANLGLGSAEIAIHDGDYQWPWADSFFRDELEAASLHTLDYSDYEGADLLHDLNQPLSSEHFGAMDVVIDGGTLEHIFHVPEALRSYMRLTKVGGRIFIFTPANDNCGHGFYQFSPEFFYRVFQESNGFEVLRMWLVTHPFPSNFLSSKEKCYEIKDPAKVSDRVIISRSGPMMLMMEARKINENQPFAAAPLQSDYLAEWHAQHSMVAKAPQEFSWKKCILNQLPLPLRYWLRGMKQRRLQSLKGSKYVSKITI